MYLKLKQFSLDKLPSFFLSFHNINIVFGWENERKVGGWGTFEEEKGNGGK